MALIAVIAPWIVKPLSTFGLLPRSFEFIDFPLVVAALFLALSRPHVDDPRLETARRTITCWLATFSALVFVSSAATGSGYTRAAAALLLTLEPFLVVLVLLYSPPTTTGVMRSRNALIAIALIQIPVAFAQWAATRNNDLVQGTLVGAGAGAHVMAGMLLLTALLIITTSRQLRFALAFSAAAIGVAVLSDAKGALFAFIPGLAVALMTKTARDDSHRSKRPWVLGGVAVGVLLALASYSATPTALGFIQRTFSQSGGKIAVANALVEDLRSSPGHTALGFGPGETVSRFAFLTTPLLLKEGSPVAWLGLGPGSRTLEYHSLASGTNIGASSFTSGQSSALGLLGDYGLLGLFAFGGLIGSVLVAMRRIRGKYAPAAFGAWAMLTPLMLVFDWFEQPPFMLSLALITGLALTERSAQRPDATRETSSRI
ncbi:MAG: hypothetical protein ACREA0_00380 [bacterium]